MSNETALVATISAAFGVAGAWNSHLPPIYEARQMDEDDDFRATQIGLLGFSLALGLVLAIATESPLPFYGIAGMAVMQAALYEWAIRANTR